MKNLFKKIITSILEVEARAILKKYQPTIIAITGSVGKTSTKDAIYTVLSGTSLNVRRSEKSFNSDIGLPLTVLGCKNGWSNPILWIKNILHGLELIIFKSKYPDILVLEVGADHPGDIQKLTAWVKPDVSVVTKVSAVPVHVEFFPSREALLLEKSYVLKALKKGGIAVISEEENEMKSMTTEKILTFGISSSATVNASHEAIIYENGMPVGMSFKLNYAGNSVPVTLRGVLGIQQIYPLIAAAAVGISRGILLTDIIQSFAKHVPPRGRMNIIKGIKESILIDDTYNSSPDALREALNVLGKLETTGRKIAVLGDMMELGKFSIEEHKKAGEHARAVASVVVTVGQRSKKMGEGIVSFDTSEQAAEYVRGLVGKGDTVLMKGSQSTRMERVVKVLLAEPEKAVDLLVRQDPEWLAIMR